MNVAAVLLLATGKWPKDDVLGQPMPPIEHPDRPGSARKRAEQQKKTDTKVTTDPKQIAAFFGLN